MNYSRLTVLGCILLFSGLAQATGQLAIRASCGWVLFHPEAVASNYQGQAVSGCLGFDKSIKERFSILISLGLNKYSFQQKYFKSLPTAPGAGRAGENGETSFQYNLDAVLLWQRNPNKLPQVMSLSPYMGFGTGLALFHQGERRWRDWDSATGEWYDVVRTGGWKPVVPTVIALFGVHIFQSERIALSSGLTSRFRLGNIHIQDYAQTLLDLAFCDKP